MAHSARRLLTVAVLLSLVAQAGQYGHPEAVRAQGATGSISGWLTEQASGDPVVSGSVCAANDNPGIPTACDTPDSTGFYRVENLAAGDYFLWWDGDPSYARMSYPHNLSFWSVVETILVDEEQETDNKNMQLESGGSLSGAVRDEDSGIGFKAAMAIDIVGDGLPPYWEGCTNLDGTYSLESMALEKDYSVFAFSPNPDCSDPGLRYLGEWWAGHSSPGALTSGDQQYVHLSAANPFEVNVDFDLESNASYGTVSGRVTAQTTGDPVSAGAVCTAVGDIGLPVACDSPDPEGYYLIKDLPTGSWAVWWDGDPAYARMTYQDHLPFWGTSELVDTVLGEVTQPIDFALRAGGRFSGQITDAETGAPIPFSTIFIDIPGDGIWAYYESCTDDEGQFRLESVALGLGFFLAGGGGGDACPLAPAFPGEFWRESDDQAHARIEMLSLAYRYRDDILFTLAPPYTTPAGEDIVVDPLPDLTLTFDSVDVAGETWADEVPPDSFPPPVEFMLVDDYFSVGTTAVFSGSIHLCFEYDDTDLTPDQEAQIRLLHSAVGGWVDVTDAGYPDLGGNVVCGSVSSLSPFAIVIPGFSLFLPAVAR